jgi:adenylyltransferase/sulfurtransferase
MELGAAQRYLRQIALPEIGPDGQQRINDATVAIAAERMDGVNGDLSAEVVARYLAAAGVGRLRLIGGDGAYEPAFAAALRGSNPDVAIEATAWPRGGDGWLAALDGADLVVRAGFDDDPMLRATVRLGIPVVLLRALDDRVEMLAVREQGPCPHVDLAIPPRCAEGASAGASSAVAGTLGASEALWLLVRHDGARDRSGRPRRKNAPARHLSLSLRPEGGAPLVQEIPWTPECFACGGGSVEMVVP